MSVKRQDIIDTAIQLFGQYGFHATGIDLIAEQAQVSKKTMYHHFRSKEELILAALKQHDGRFRNFFMKAVQQVSDSPRERLLGIYDVAQTWFCDKHFYGCLFINAVAEFSDGDTMIRRACQDYKTQMTAFIEELVSAVGIQQSHELALALSLLLEGSIVTAQVAGRSDAAKHARAAAEVLVDAALTEGVRRC